MTDRGLTFRDLIAPLGGDEFLSRHYRREPIHIPGAADKLARLFSWDELNGLLAMSTIWSPISLELAKDGKRIAPEAYCYEGTTRDNERGLLPDFDRVRGQLNQGATLSLNAIARLTPGLRSIAESLEAVFGAPANAVAFCSFEGSAGYFSHFDTTNIFACQIGGTKLWRVYDGRHPNAAEKPHGRGNELPREHHAKARGQVVLEVEMSPGDVLYVPHGQYHDAIATSGASLHITLAVRHLVVQDFISRLSQDLPRDPFFRAHLPAYDDPAGQEALGQQVAQRLSQIITNPSIAGDLGRFLQGKAYERESAFQLPERSRPTRYRVRWPGRPMSRNGAAWQVAGLNLDDNEGPVAQWIHARDLFDQRDLAAYFPDHGAEALKGLLAKLVQSGLLEPV